MLCSESMRHTAPPWSLQKKTPLFQKEVAHRRKMAVSGWSLRLGNEGNASHPISLRIIRNLSGRDVIVALNWFTKIWDPDWGIILVLQTSQRWSFKISQRRSKPYFTNCCPIEFSAKQGWHGLGVSLCWGCLGALVPLAVLTWIVDVHGYW